MGMFDWLKPRKLSAEGIPPSALAQMLVRGSAAVLPAGALLVNTYPEAQRIAESLRDFPDDWAWRHKGYELEHVPTRFAMWVANKDYGLAEMTQHGGKQDFEGPEQQIIWPAVEAWLARGKVGFTGRLPKVKITAKRGTYWCVADGHPWAGAGNSPADAYRSWSRAVSIQARKDTSPEEQLHVWSSAL